MKEQNRPVCLVFKTGEGRFHAFNLVAWKARSDHIITIDSAGKMVCDCQMYRFDNKCQHTKAISDVPMEFVRGASDWRKGERPIKWAELEMKFMLVSDVTKPVSGVMHPDVGNLSALDVVFLLTNSISDIPKEIKERMDDANSFFNPRRVYAELTVSSNKNLTLIDGQVKAAGEAVKPLTKADVDLGDDFDDELVEVELTPEPSVAAVPKASTPGAPIDWKSVKRPDPKQFYTREDDWRQLIYKMLYGDNVLIVGPSGSGKSEMAYVAAKAVSLPIEAFNFGAMQEPRTSLIGATHFDKERGTWFAESRFVRAVRSARHAILLDELTRDRGASAHNILLPLLDRQGYLALDESEDSPVVKKGDAVCFIATANVGMEYTGTEALDKALMQRFSTIIDMTWPPKEYEVKILLYRCPGLRAGDASRLVDIATVQRKMAEEDGEFVESISTRMLLAAGEKVGRGMSFDDAVKYSIVHQFSKDGGDASDRVKVAQIIQKGLKL